MKTLPVLLISAALILSACTPIGTCPSTQNTTTATTEATTSGETALYRDIYFTSLDEYNAYFTENEDIQLSVTYEKLRGYGDFTYFIFLSRASVGKYDQYYYSLCDSLGYEFNLSIKPKERVVSSNDYDVVDRPIDGDMRSLDEPRSGYCGMDEINYIYFQGELQYITWWRGDLTFELSIQEDFATYPKTDTTFVGKMLNIATAPEAVAAFTEAIG